jgi:flagellar biosynthesis/type III secretory pathway protein FliH
VEQHPREQLRKRLEEEEKQLERAKEEAERKRRELEEQKQRVEMLADELEQARQRVLGDNEEELVNLSLRIAEKVVGHEIENGRYKVERIVRAALDAAPRKEEAVVHLNPDDCEPVRQSVQRDDGGLPDGLTIAEDGEVPRGSCRVETPGGDVTSGVRSRLEQIEEGLLKTPRE